MSTILYVEISTTHTAWVREFNVWDKSKFLDSLRKHYIKSNCTVVEITREQYLKALSK
jgi:hypothetical protein